MILENDSFSDRLADGVARFGGSWTFIIIFIFVIVLWVGFNSIIFFYHFDPYPYIFLNLILSMVAALQAPVILMSQNRQAIKDRVTNDLDYAIDSKVGIDVISLHEKLDRVILHLKLEE